MSQGGAPAVTYYRAQSGAQFIPSGFETEAPMIDLWKLINIFKKWWWLIASIAALVTGLTALVVYRMTPVYMASSVLEIKQKDRQIFNASEVEGLVVDKEFFNTQVELLKSDTLAENVIDSLNLGADVDFSSIDAGSRESTRGVMVRSFAGKLHIAPIGRSRLIKVSFEHTNPATAARITNAVTDTFISYNMERKYNATSYARDFIEERLASTKEILEVSERELARYASENDLVMVAGGQQTSASPGYLDGAALITLDAALTQAQTTRIEHEQRYNLAVQSIDNAPELLESKTIQALKTQRIELNSEYRDKLSVFKPEFPDMTELKSRIDYIDTQIAIETQQVKDSVLSALKIKYQIAVDGEKNLEERVEALKVSVTQVRDKSVDYNILEREVDTNRTQYAALLQRLKEVSISDEIGSNLISLVDKAKPPAGPFKPNKLLSMLLALILGTALGSGLVFAIEMIDDRIKTPDDIKNKLSSSIMGVIPNVRNMSDVTEMLGNPESSIAEAYASLRTNLQFSGPDGGPKVIHVTSTRSGEGKSVSSLALALRFAGIGEKVLLIDADMRLPTFLNGKGRGESIGLSGLLTSAVDPGAHMQQTKFANMDLLPSGKSVPNPSEILATYRLDEILEYARQHYDHIIVDSPPVMGIADAPLLAASCDASLLVVEHANMRTSSY